jgi:hypothetical protein
MRHPERIRTTIITEAGNVSGHNRRFTGGADAPRFPQCTIEPTHQRLKEVYVLRGDRARIDLVCHGDRKAAEASNVVDAHREHFVPEILERLLGAEDSRELRFTASAVVLIDEADVSVTNLPSEVGAEDVVHRSTEVARSVNRSHFDDSIVPEGVDTH